VEFNEVLAIRRLTTDHKADGAPWTGQVVQEDRHKKILVFHLKRKKQYKENARTPTGLHRRAYYEIAFEGQKFSATGAGEKAPKKKKGRSAQAEATARASKSQD